MTNEEIKEGCEQMYAQIKSAEERLKELRGLCRHEKTFTGNYSWRVGAHVEGEICEYCLTFVKATEEHPPYEDAPLKWGFGTGI